MSEMKFQLIMKLLKMAPACIQEVLSLLVLDSLEKKV